MLPQPNANQNAYTNDRLLIYILILLGTLAAAIGIAFGIWFATDSVLFSIFVTPPAVGLLAIFIYLIAVKRSVRAALLTISTAFVITILVGASFIPAITNDYQALIFFCLALAIFLFAFFASQSTRLSHWLETHGWNWKEKMYGGAIAGDLTSFVGVVAVINAHRAVDGDGWWWLAMFGGFLAFIVGASQLWRWIKLDENDQIVPMLLNLVVGITTAMSLFADPPSDLGYERWIVLSVWYAYLLGLGIFFIALIVSDNLRARLNCEKTFTTRQRVSWAIFLFFLIFGTLGTLIGFPLSGFDNEIASLIIGAIGVAAWTLAELFSALRRVGRWAYNYEDWTNLVYYLEWEKNWWEAVAGYAILIHAGADITYISRGWGDLPAEYDIVFLLGVSFGLFGTLRGILKGLIAKPHKAIVEDVQTDRTIAQLWRTLGPPVPPAAPAPQPVVPRRPSQ